MPPAPDPTPRFGPAALRRALQSLKVRITLGGLVVLALGIGLITALLVKRAEHDLLRMQRHHELGESARTAAQLSRQVVELQRALQAVARQLDPATLGDAAELRRFIMSKPVLQGLFTDVFIATPEGDVRLYANATGVHPVTLNLGDRAYFRRTLAEARPLVSEPVQSRIYNQPVLVFTQPVRNAEGIHAVLAGTLLLTSRDLLDGLVDMQDSDAQTLITVTDGLGRVLAHPRRDRLLRPLSDEPRLAQAFAAWLASGSPFEPQGLVLPQPGEMVSAAAVPGVDWTVWRTRSEAELLAPLRDARRRALQWAGGLILALSPLLLAFLWWLLRPLSLLARRAAHLFDGTLDPEAGWPAASGEIGRLAQVLRRVGAERAQLEARNSQVLGRLGSVMSAAPLGIAFTRDGRFELASTELCRLFGHAQHDLLGQPLSFVLAAPQDHATLTAQAQAAFAADRPYVGEWRMARRDGTHFWARLRSKPVDAADLDSGAIWTLGDIDEQRVAREQLEWSARHDPLTGLANRRAFEERAAHLLATRPGSLPAALVFIDLDHFKPVNDLAGHLSGDLMLRAVAAAITSQVRAGDLVTRLGGDEFALLLGHCGQEVAVTVAHGVRLAIAAVALSWQQRTLSVDASIGVALLTPEMADVAAWVRAADAACYAAKAAGRGTVVAATPQAHG